MFRDTHPLLAPRSRPNPLRCSTVVSPHESDLDENGHSLRRILDDWYPKAIVVAHVAGLACTLRNPLDLLHALNLEARMWSRFSLNEQRNEHSPLRMRVDTASCSTLVESSQEERRAL